MVRAIGCDREIELVVDLLIGRSIRPSRQAFFTRAVSERVIDFHQIALRLTLYIGRHPGQPECHERAQCLRIVAVA